MFLVMLSILPSTKHDKGILVNYVNFMSFCRSIILQHLLFRLRLFENDKTLYSHCLSSNFYIDCSGRKIWITKKQVVPFTLRNPAPSSFLLFQASSACIECSSLVYLPSFIIQLSYFLSKIFYYIFLKPWTNPPTTWLIR